MLTRHEEYHRWGSYCWVIDPENQVVWQYAKGEQPTCLDLTDSAKAGDIKIAEAKIFAD